MEGLGAFYKNYLDSCRQSGVSEERVKELFQMFVGLVKRGGTEFSSYHKAVRAPFDYYQFGLDFVRPLIDFQKSSVSGQEWLENIARSMERGENVILLSNHQTEIDPQIISLLLEKKFPRLAEEMIFMAGHRVVQDPLAAPMSMGRNLLCIYSKKYVNDPPEKKAEKLLHNRKTLAAMQELLKEGGKCVYVAPSGGRDREDSMGKVEPAAFDPDSIEMLLLVAKKAGTPTHFHTLALYTYPLLPPPKEMHVALGEERKTAFVGAHLAFGKEVEMEKSVDGIEDKQKKREKRADVIWQQVVADYRKFGV